MWHNEKLSFILITKNNEKTIKNVIEDAFYTGFVDEVLVIDLGSKDRTLSEISHTRARLTSAENYESAFRKGFERSDGKLLIFGDSKGYVPAKELVKLTAYSNDYDVVLSSRTAWIGHGQRKNEKKYILSNKKIASFISRMMNTVDLTDINSMMFLFNKNHVNASDFIFELSEQELVFEIILNIMRNGFSHVQIPVEFHQDVSKTDTLLFNSFLKPILLKKKILSIKKDYDKKSHDIAQKKRYTSNIIDKQFAPATESDKYDPIWVKRRIQFIKKRLNSAYSPWVSEKVSSEVNTAIEEIISEYGENKKKNKKQNLNIQKKTKQNKKSPREKQKNKLTLEEQYQRLKDIEAKIHNK